MFFLDKKHAVNYWNTTFYDWITMKFGWTFKDDEYLFYSHFMEVTYV